MRARDFWECNLYLMRLERTKTIRVLAAFGFFGSRLRFLMRCAENGIGPDAAVVNSDVWVSRDCTLCSHRTILVCVWCAACDLEALGRRCVCSFLCARFAARFVKCTCVCYWGSRRLHQSNRWRAVDGRTGGKIDARIRQSSAHESKNCIAPAARIYIYHCTQTHAHSGLDLVLIV
jgi:hypothetical protein